MSEAYDTETLTEHLQEQVAGRRVLAGVFTTYTFEPGFFELHVLPALFDRRFSHIDKVRLALLEEELRDAGPLAVYYDRRALCSGAASAQLDVHRIPVSRTSGAFHPKIVLLLLETPATEKIAAKRTLLVGALSANLTEAGWWRNLECARFEQIGEGDKSTLRGDLLDFIKVLKAEDKTGDEHVALETIARFLRHHVEPAGHQWSQNVLQPRLFFGQKPLPDFLKELIAPGIAEYNLEVISPYFDLQVPAALKGLREALFPRETRVLLPLDSKAAAACSRRYFEALPGVKGAYWAKLDDKKLTGSGDELQDHRPVHAKVYRLWNRDKEREVLVVGSVNMTIPGHTRHSTGNLEAALVFGQPLRSKSFWLERIKTNSRPAFRNAAETEDAAEPGALPIAVRFDWSTGKADYFLEGKVPKVLLIRIGLREGHKCTSVKSGTWTGLPESVCQELQGHLVSSSFIEVASSEGANAKSSVILVTETGMQKKPSLISNLTVEEILRYWSMLSDDQREALLVEKARGLTIGGANQLEPDRPPPPEDPGIKPRGASIFDGFAGIFHAFSRFEWHVREALEGHNTKEADYRLFGEKYDSLPHLLRRLLEPGAGSPVNGYVSFLSAHQLLRRMRKTKEFKSFFHTRQAECQALDDLLEKRAEIRRRLTELADSHGKDFLGWLDERFLAEARGGEA